VKPPHVSERGLLQEKESLNDKMRYQSEQGREGELHASLAQDSTTLGFCLNFTGMNGDDRTSYGTASDTYTKASIRALIQLAGDVILYEATHTWRCGLGFKAIIISRQRGPGL
jgi:hypothetical protein